MRTMRMILLALTLEFLATLGFAQESKPMPMDQGMKPGAMMAIVPRLVPKPSPLFPPYELARQALLAASLDAVKSSAASLASGASASKQPEIAADAGALAKSSDIESARHAFAALSDAMIAYCTAGNEQPKPQVVYCSMAKRSWLQPKGAISNPYYADPAMRGCGEVKSN